MNWESINRAAESKALGDIEKYGCHIIRVLAGDGKPPFCYSIGIQKSCGCPEVVVIGMKHEVAQFMINEYNSRVRKDGSLQIGGRYPGFIEGFDCVLQPVDEAHHREYFGWNEWLYDGQAYDVVQLVYPTTSGLWPWDKAATEDFRKWQPLLTADGSAVSFGSQ